MIVTYPLYCAVEIKVVDQEKLLQRRVSLVEEGLKGYRLTDISAGVIREMMMMMIMMMMMMIMMMMKKKMMMTVMMMMMMMIIIIMIMIII